MSVSARGVAAVVVTAAMAAVLTMAYVVAAGRLLGPAEYSDFGAALSLVYFTGLALSPLTPTVSRLCAMYAAQNDLVAVASLRRQVMLLFAGGVAFPVAILCLVSGPIARALHFRSAAALVLGLVIAVLYAVLSIDRGVVHGFFRFGVHNANTLIETGVRLMAGVALLLWFRRSAPVALAAYVLAMIAAELVLIIHGSALSPDAARRPTPWGELRRLTVPIGVLMAGVAIFQNADMLTVKRYFSPDTSGAYAAATTLARSIGVLFASLYIVMTPVLARLYEEGRPVAGAALRLTATFVAISVPAVAVLAAWPQRIVMLLYGSSYIAAAPLLAPLAGIAVITYTGLMLAQALITVGRNRFLIAYSAVALAQIAVLLVFHGTIRQIFASLYVCQTAALLLVALIFLNSQKIVRDGNNSSKT